MSSIQYNKKEFLLPKSPNSMACYHAKIDNGMMKLTIHDCRGSIQLWNDLTLIGEPGEAINKLLTLEKGIEQLREFIQKEYL
jgi:hypothetical protein